MQEVAEVLDRLNVLGASRERVTVDDIQGCLGRDAFGPTLLALGLLALSPVGDIPGAPTVLGIFIFSIGLQMAAGRKTLWIPRPLARRSVKGRRLRQAASLFSTCYAGACRDHQGAPDLPHRGSVRARDRSNLRCPGAHLAASRVRSFRSYRSVFSHHGFLDRARRPRRFARLDIGRPYDRRRLRHPHSHPVMRTHACRAQMNAVERDMH